MALTASAQTPAELFHVPELDIGFHLLYELKPVEALAQFEAWQKSHPEDPLGSAAEAAAYLFEECYRQGILTSHFFPDNQRFLGKVSLKPKAELRAAFFRRRQRGAAPGEAPIAGESGRHQRPVLHDPKPGLVSRLCQFDR